MCIITTVGHTDVLMMSLRCDDKNARVLECDAQFIQYTAVALLLLVYVWPSVNTSEMVISVGSHTVKSYT